MFLFSAAEMKTSSVHLTQTTTSVHLTQTTTSVHLTQTTSSAHLTRQTPSLASTQQASGVHLSSMTTQTNVFTGSYNHLRNDKNSVIFIYQSWNFTP